MAKSYRRDIQLLLIILKNQNKIIDAIKTFNCTSNNLEQNQQAFDLCSFYMAQIGETSKLLTDSTKASFQYFDYRTTKYFRDMIDHVYEKVNKTILKAYIFAIINPSVMKEIEDRIKYCQDNVNSEPDGQASES